MKTAHANKKSRVHRNCLNCNKLYVPDRHNRWHQRYCDKPECRKASKRQSQTKWLNKPENRDYFKGDDNRERVREWRKIHPEYWKRHKKARPKPLQEISKSQPIDNQQDKSFRHLVTQGDALQDFVITQHPVIVGLVSMVSGNALQESVEKTMRTLFDRGQDILGRQRSGLTTTERSSCHAYDHKDAAPA